MTSCMHKSNEEHMFCFVCGLCSESLDEEDICADCKGEVEDGSE